MIYRRVKLARAGVGGNFCILKHFYDASPMWRRIREEGNKQDCTPTIKSGEQITETKGSLSFGPIDALHLADLNVLRTRITKLLLGSPKHTHVTKDLIITLVSFLEFRLRASILTKLKGFENPTKTERRFFSTRLNELINLGVVEKVTLTNSSTGKASTQCIRLVKTDAEESAGAAPAEPGPSTQLDKGQGMVLKNCD